MNRTIRNWGLTLRDIDVGVVILRKTVFSEMIRNFIYHVVFLFADKRDTSDTEGDSLVPENLEDADDKRSRIFRYGRGATIFRYGKRAPVFRYGKRGATIFRYGKRDDSDDVDDLYNDDLYAEGPGQWKRLFRWGKRDGDNLKRIFRWGKRSDEDEDEDVKRVFRYGKRADWDSDIEEELMKRKMFAFGKRDGMEDEDEKRSRIFRYGRSGLTGPAVRDVRAPNQPHVPFRFGDK